MTKEFIVFKHLDKLSELCFKNNTQLSTNHFLELRKICLALSSDTSFGDFKTWFKLQDGLLSLECLWQLQLHNILQFTTYIHYNAHGIHGLSDKFEDLIWCQDDSVRAECAETVGGLLSVLVNLGIHTPQDVYTPGHQLMTLVIQKFVSRLLQDDGALDDPVPFLQYLLKSPSCVQSRLTPFCLTVLRAMVQSNPESVALEDALKDQAALYTSSKTSSAITQVLHETLSSLTTMEVINDISQVITSEEEFNWKWLLTVISVLTASSLSEAVQSIKGMISTLMGQACASRSTRLLGAALLCARQCCTEDSQKFGTYSSWFSSLQLRPASSFTFFFDFLSQLVPDEPILCLKIHINKVPSAPPNCHGVIADYASLAKTRLADLNQTTDYMGLFGEYTTTEQEGREADVGRVVAHFKQTKEVMKVVLEASVFRRQFYEKVFLAQLLRDSNTENKEFIEKLYSLGKIPYGLYNRWCLLY